MKRIKEKNGQTVAFYTLLHCIVDFCCIYFMMYFVRPACIYHDTATSQWLFYIVLYNFIAFAGQLPVGILGDYWERNAEMVGSSLLLLLVAYLGRLFFSLPILPAILLIGVANAFFHIGGGRAALQHRENTCGTVGIFVATGAFGVYGGKWFVGKSDFLPILVCILLAVLFLVQCVVCRRTERKRCHFQMTTTNGSWSLLLAVCCILVVVLRSFSGTVFSFPWSSGWLTLLLTVAVVLGKAVGGILADRFGMQRTVLVSLTCSALLFLGANAVSVMGLLAVFLFNMTMPITLSLLAMQFPQAKGTAFGALTFAIFLGLLPSYFCNIRQFSQPAVYVVLAAASLVLLYVPLWAAKKQSKMVETA